MWREAECFTASERAALRWCEALTNLPANGAPDDAYEEVAGHYEADELVALTIAIAAINGWNRLNVAFQSPTGGYVSPRKPLDRAG